MLASMTSHNVRGAVALGETPLLFPRRGVFGAASTASKGVGNLQSALEALSRRVDDHKVATSLDGRMGPLTAAATNRALKVYANTAPLTLRTGSLTQSQILAQLAAITGYINAAQGITAKVTSGIYRPPQTTQPIQTQLQPASSYSASAPRGATMPAPGYYPPPPGYAPAPGYYPPSYPPRGPGGLPTDRATFDVKAFIPAQYEHIQLSGATIAMLGLGGIIVFMLVKQRRGEKKER